MKLEVWNRAGLPLIDDDHEFEEEEAWLGECQENFMNMEYRAKIYIDTIVEGKDRNRRERGFE